MVDTEEIVVRTDENILEMPELDYQPSGGLGCEYFRMMKLFSNRVAQIDAETGNEETYAILLQKCVRTAIKLQSENITPSDIICLCTYNHMNSIVPFISAAFIGSKVASLDPTLSIDDTSHLLKQVNPKIIFLVPEAIDLIVKSIKNAKLECKLVIFGECDNYQQFEEYLEENTEEESNFQPVVTDPNDTAVIFFSSGTTGMPKGICQGSYALLAQGVNLLNHGFVNSSSVVLLYSSLYWISAALFLTAVTQAGAARLVCKKFDPKLAWSLLHDFKITLLFVAPSQALGMVKAGRPDGIDTTNLTSLVTGGGVISKVQVESIRDVLPGTFVISAYGQTEVAGVLTTFKQNNVRETILGYYKPNSCGRPIVGINYKIVDPETENVLGPNENGELRVLTNYAMNGYYNMDSSEAFDSEGWLKTGDVAYYDDDYCFYVIDRIKEMLKYQSWHIPPALLENIARQHPAVRQVVVIGIPHEEDGDHPMAVVVLDDSFKDSVSEEDILEFVNSKVPDRQKLRGGVKFIDKIPTTPSGKVKRQMLKKMILG